MLYIDKAKSYFLEYLLAMSGKGNEKKILDIELSVAKKLREHIKN